MELKEIHSSTPLAKQSLRVAADTGATRGKTNRAFETNVTQQIKADVEKTHETEFTNEEILDQVEGMNKLLGHYTSLKFTVHDKLNRVTVEVINTETEEVIREVPPKELLDMVAKMLEQVGLIVDEKL